MRSLLVFGLIFVLGLFSSAVAQDPPPAPVPPVPRPAVPPPPPAADDPTVLSPKLERTLSEIQELQLLREDYKRLQDRLLALEAESDQLTDVVLRGVAFGASGSSVALLQINDRKQLVRKGSELSSPRARGGQASGGLRLIVRQILEDSVIMEIADSGKLLVIR